MRGSIVPRGILTLGLSVVLLAATANSASAFVSVDPTSADFGDQQVDTTSLPQPFTLNVAADCVDVIFIGEICQGVLIAPAPSVTGDFAQTTDCLTLVLALTSDPVSCTTNVTFTPTSTGPKTGTLSIGGLTAALTGNGVETPTPLTPPTPGSSPPPPTSGGSVSQLTPTPPLPGQPALQLDLDAKKQKLKKKLTFFATTNVESSLIVGGSVKQTVKQLAAAAKTQIKAKLKPKKFKRLEQKLDRTGKAKAKIEATATSPTSGTVIDEIKVKLKG